MALIGFLIALGAGGPVAAQAGGLPADTDAAAETATTPSASLDDPWSSPDIAAPRMEPRPLPRRPDPGKWSSAASSAGGRGSGAWVRTTVALGGVVALIMLLAWGYRRVAGGGSLRLPFRSRQAVVIEVVGRTALSPRQSVCLVRVGPRLVLVGCTPDSVRPLDVIHDADLAARLLGQAAQQRPDSHSAAFTSCLEEEAGSYGSERGVSDEAVSPQDDRLRAVREKLTGTIQRLRATVAQT